MTFEVSDSKAIDIEALKVQMQGYLNFILSMPNLYKSEKTDNEEWTEEQEREAFLTTSQRNAAQICAKYL